MRLLLPLILVLSSTAMAAPDDIVRARDLNATVMPHRLDFEPSTLQLEVDGKRVRGSLRKQLDYLEVVLASDRGVEPSELGFDRRRRELRRRNTGVGLLYAASGVGIVATVFLPPVTLALAPTLALDAGGIGIVIGTKKRFDAEGLQREVDLYGLSDVYTKR